MLSMRIPACRSMRRCTDGLSFAGRRGHVRLAVVLLLCLAGASVSGQGTADNGAAHDAATHDRAAGGVAVDLSSPRATMFTFLAAMNRVHDGYEDAWPAALATMAAPEDASPTSDARQREQAEALVAVLDRLGEVRPGDLPTAEELAIAAAAGRTPIRRFLYFPRTQHAWVWTELQQATSGQVTAPRGRIELAIVESGERKVWRFTAETVAGAPELYESMRALPPRYTAPRDEAAGELFELLGPTFHRTPWWGWGALLAGIFVGLLVGKIAQTALRRVGDDLLRRAWDIRARALHDAASPASLALLTVGLHVGLWFVVKTEDVAAFTGRIISFLFIVAVGWLLYNLVDVIDVALRRAADRTNNKLDNMVVPLIRKTLRIFLVVIFTFVVAENVFGLDLTAWLAGLGIAGLAVSLSAQDSIKNLFGSLTIFFDKPFAIGDFITFDDETGVVEEIGFRSTRLRLLSGHLVTVPNMKFIDNKIENISARPYIRREMNVTITYDTPPDKIEQAVRILRDILHSEEVVREGRFDMEKQPPRISFNEFNADSLNIRAYYWYQLVRDPDRGFFTFIAHSQMVNMKLFAAYGEAGIDFAFPTQTLYLAGDPARQLAVKVIGDDAGE